MDGGLQGHNVLPQNKISGHSIQNYAQYCYDCLSSGNFPGLLHETMRIIDYNKNNPGYELFKKENLVHIYILFSSVWKPDPYSWRGEEPLYQVIKK